jgi:4-phytase / acid phosphatase
MSPDSLAFSVSIGFCRATRRTTALRGALWCSSLRQSQSTGESIVRTSYIAQTLDQLRNRTVLTLTTPPASAPVFIPGCSTRNARFDCALADFVAEAKRAIDPKSADLID